MRKGFAFSIDALLAVVVAIILIAGIFTNISRDKNKVENAYLQKVANDILVTLNKNKTLDTLNKTLIENILNEVTPAAIDYTLNITVYECQDQDCRSFVTVDGNSIYISSSTLAGSDSVTAKRVFLTFQDSRIKYFNTAELKVWST